MKYVSFFFFATCVFISCSKDSNNDTQVPDTQTPAALQNKTWLLDSVLTVTPNYTNVIYPDVNIKQTVVFGSDTLVELTGASHVTYNTSYDGVNKLYFWLSGNTENANMYRQIDFVSDSHLVNSQFPQSEEQVIFYYHAK